MNLLDIYPSASEFIKIERLTLEFLKDDPTIWEWQPEFANAANAHYQKFRNVHAFDFGATMRIQHDRRELQVSIEGLIDPLKDDYNNITYCLSIWRGGETMQLLRKFHFDAASNRDLRAQKQPHPMCHLQYGGKLTPHLESIGCSKDDMETMHGWLSEPRIAYWPVSLALLLDLVLREFPTEEARKFRERHEWRHVVQRNEEMLLLEFHRRCVQVLEGKSKHLKILSDIFYPHGN